MLKQRNPPIKKNMGTSKWVIASIFLVVFIIMTTVVVALSDAGKRKADNLYNAIKAAAVNLSGDDLNIYYDIVKMGLQETIDMLENVEERIGGSTGTGTTGTGTGNGTGTTGTGTGTGTGTTGTGTTGTGNQASNTNIIFGCNESGCNESLDLSKQYNNKEVVIKSDSNDISAYITKPLGESMSIVILLHGTTNDNEKSREAAKDMPGKRGGIEKLSSYFLISVGYKEKDIAIGDDVIEPEEAFSALWNNKNLQNFKTKKIFLLGHSRGGYIATMINTRRKSDGIIVNGAGPMDIGKTCEMLSKNPSPTGAGIEMQNFCDNIMAKRYGSLILNRKAYDDLRIENNICKSLSPILFIQGDKDKLIQINEFTSLEKYMKSGNCNIKYETMWVTGAGHAETFLNPSVWNKIASFLENPDIITIATNAQN